MIDPSAMLSWSAPPLLIGITLLLGYRPKRLPLINPQGVAWLPDQTKTLLPDVRPESEPCIGYGLTTRRARQWLRHHPMACQDLWIGREGIQAWQAAGLPLEVSTDGD